MKHFRFAGIAVTSLGFLAGCLWRRDNLRSGPSLPAPVAEKTGKKDLYLSGDSPGAVLQCDIIKPDGTTTSSQACDCRDLSKPLVSSRRVMLKEGGKVVEYMIINEPVPSETPGQFWARGLVTLVRREFGVQRPGSPGSFGIKETKMRSTSDCFGRGERIATDGKNVYVVYERAVLPEDPLRVHVGKVVKEGAEWRIGFFRRQIPPDLKQADTVRFAQDPETGALHLAVGWKGKFSDFFSPLTGDEVVEVVRPKCP